MPKCTVDNGYNSQCTIYNRGVRMQIFWRTHQCVPYPHHCLANSTTFQDLALQVLEILQKIQDFPRGVGTPHAVAGAGVDNYMKMLLRVSWPTLQSAAAASSSDGGCADACRREWRLSSRPTHCKTTAQNDSHGSSLISHHTTNYKAIRLTPIQR